MENIINTNDNGLSPMPVEQNKKEYAKWFIISFFMALLSLNIGTIFLVRHFRKLDDYREKPSSLGALVSIAFAAVLHFIWAIFLFNASFDNWFFIIVLALLTALAIAATLFLIDAIASDNPKETIFKRLFFVCATLVIVFVSSIIAFLIVEGSPAMARIGFFDFVFGRTWDANRYDTLYGEFQGQYGIFNMIVNSLLTMVGAVILGGALGVLTAVFLAKFCPRKLKPILIQIINLLAGIPSVVFGFFAMAVLLPANPRSTFFGLFDFRLIGLGAFSENLNGMGILSVVIVLAIMIVPITVALARTSIDAVDQSYMEGALALGATKSQAVFKVVLPAAKSGVFAAIILGIGRAIGETMAVAMVQGGSPRIAPGMFGSFRSLTAHIIMGQAYGGILNQAALVASGTILLIFVLIINLAFNLVKGKSKSGEAILVVAFRKTKEFVLSVVSFFKRLINKNKHALDTGEGGEEIASDSSLKMSSAILQPLDSANSKYLDDISHDLENPQAIFTATQQAESCDIFIEEVDIKTNNAVQKPAVAQTRQEQRIAKNASATRPSFEQMSSSTTKVMPVILKVLSIIAASFAVFILVFIIFYILSNGVHHLSPQLLFGEFEFGGAITIASSIVSTFMIIALAGVIGFPLGIITAIYLVEYTKRGSKFVKVIRLAVETLAGIPSVVFGLFGMIFFGIMFGWDVSLLGGALTVSIMIIPVTVRATEEALLAVPDSFREGSLALGAGKIRTVYKVILPSALPGILAAVILGIGRMMAESAALVFTAGATMGAMPTGFFSSGTTLTVALFGMAREYGAGPNTFATASLLIMIVLTLNIVATIIVNKLQKRLLGKAAKKLKKKIEPPPTPATAQQISGGG